MPNGLAVCSPQDAKGPARQLLPGIPLALAYMHKAVWRVMRLELVHDFCSIGALGRPLCVGVPFAGIAVGGGHKGGLAAHRQAHIACA